MLSPRGTYYHCIELLAYNSEGLTCNWVSLISKNKGVSVANKNQFEGSWNDFTAKWPQTGTLVLLINTQQTIQRVGLAERATETAYIKQILPTEKPENYYSQVVTSSDKKAHVALLQKQELETILSHFQDNKVTIDQLLCGPFYTLPLLPGIPGKSIGANGYIFNQQDGDLLSIAKGSAADSTTKVFDEEVANIYLPALSGALGSISKQNDTYALDHEATLLQQESKTRLNKVQKVCKTLLYKSLEQKTKKKESQLAKAGLFEQSKTAFLIDRLMAIRPTGIRLNQLEVFPLEDEDELIFQPNHIIIQGTHNSSSSLNNWMKTIRDYAWVETVEIINYSETAGKKSAFELNIRLQ